MKNKYGVYFGLVMAACLVAACNRRGNQEEVVTALVTPVEVEFPHKGVISQKVELLAVSAYLQKEILRSPTVGYVERVDKIIGQAVKGGEPIMVLKTREAKAIHEQARDTSLQFTGLVTIAPSLPGIISQIDHLQGDFVAESDPLAIIVQPASLVFFLKVPFAYRSLIQAGKEYPICLPDGTVLKGTIGNAMPSVDPTTQVQDYLMKPTLFQSVPENLYATIPITIQAKADHLTLIKSCVLSNETQTEFWVMKLLNDSTAIKVPVVKGIESDSLVEIVSPQFEWMDRFVSEGSYGLPDTARIKIMPTSY